MGTSDGVALQTLYPAGLMYIAWGQCLRDSGSGWDALWIRLLKTLCRAQTLDHIGRELSTSSAQASLHLLGPRYTILTQGPKTLHRALIRVRVPDPFLQGC